MKFYIVSADVDVPGKHGYPFIISTKMHPTPQISKDIV